MRCLIYIFGSILQLNRYFLFSVHDHFFCFQRGDAFKALFRVNAHNRLEVCTKGFFMYGSLWPLVLFREMHVLRKFFHFRPTAKLMECKRTFSLVDWWIKIEL